MKQLVVTGYASLDYAVGLAGQAVADSTTLIASRDVTAWPRAGGCPTYIAAAAHHAGLQAVPVMWVGRGHEAKVFTTAVAALGLSVQGIGHCASTRSPTALMLHQADGSTICLYDPALDGAERLTDAQRALIGTASHLCISVGPPQLMAAILAACPSDARLYWAVKNDAVAFPLTLCARLSARADVIFHNASERGLIAPGRAILVETRGSAGVCVTDAGKVTTLPVQPIAPRDTTGAGDSFAGGYIAAEMSGANPIEAARAGIAAAAALLASRAIRKAQ
jgi:ribokinase